jgi:catechol 2,3-dioxygenase-like lactoylglutathione lyase family enzyme
MRVTKPGAHSDSSAGVSFWSAQAVSRRCLGVSAPVGCKNEDMLSVGTIVMGVDDLQRAVAFWTQALDYVPKREIKADDDFAILVPPTGHGAHLALDVSETPVQQYPRVHLDLYAGDAADQAAEVERLLSLGATRVDWDRYPENPDFVVLADPEGNRFCVIDTGQS